MPWFKVDDGFTNSKPVLRIPRKYRTSAIGLWTLAGAWAAKELTDGFIPEYLLEELASTPAIAAHLVKAELWEIVDGGWNFIGWTKYQPTREFVMAEREREAERKRKYRESKSKSKSDATYFESVSENENRGHSDQQHQESDTANPPPHLHLVDQQQPEMSQWDNDGTTPGQTVGHQADSGHPDPTRPDPTLTKEVKEGGTRKRATRLPEGWMPPQDLIDKTKADCPLVDLKRSHEMFSNHWASKSGKDATKVEWSRAWRNWMLEDQNRAERRPGGRQAAPSRKEQTLAFLHQEFLKGDDSPPPFGAVTHTTRKELTA
jgi:hypothetical protein